jgi:hypothetical protein
MIISNSFSVYSKEDLIAFREIVHEMNNYLENTNQIFKKESKEPTPPKDNIIHINPRIVAEFKQLEKAPVPFHEALAVYREWHEELLVLADKNIGNYHRVKVQMHVEDIMNICKTFGALVNSMT